MIEQFRAFVQFLADQPNGLITGYQVTERVKPVSYDMAKLAILQLAKMGLSCQKLVRRCRHRKWGNDLLRALATHFRGKKRWKNFVRAVIRMPAGCWGKYFSIGVAQEILDQPDVMELIIREHPEVLQKDDHPLFDCFRPDTYWTSVVRRYIATYDYHRAYDEVKKASKGIRVGQPHEEADKNPFKPDTAPRRFAASKQAVGQLVRELFAAMVAHRVLQPLAEGDHALGRKKERVTVYETKPRGHRKPRKYEQCTTVAGLEFARLFLIRPACGSYENRQPDIFSPEGGMILTMARHFADKKSEFRRRKHDAAVAEYEQRQQQPPSP